MLTWLTWIIVGSSVLAVLLAGIYAWRDRLIDDPLILLLALTEVALLAQVVVVLAHVGNLAEEKGTFVAYALSLPVIPPFAAFLAIKEKTRWAMATVAVGAFAVAVMTGRLEQIWSLHAR